MKMEPLLFVSDSSSRRVVRSGLIAALDIGTTKVCCFVARVNSEGGIRVSGIGHQLCTGVKSGNIIDMDSVEASISSAVDAAEGMAGDRKIEKVFVNLSAGQPSSKVAMNALRKRFGSNARISKPVYVIFAGLEGDRKDPALAYVSEVELGNKFLGTFEKYRYIVDANNGSILHTDDLII
mgnify:CR=1 FL=1